MLLKKELDHATGVDTSDYIMHTSDLAAKKVLLI